MRRSIRTLLVCLLVALIVYQPALACHSCGGWGGGYQASPYYSYGPVVYSGGCSGCGYETDVYESGCGCCGGHDAAMHEDGPNVPTDSMEAPTTTAAPPSPPADVTPAPQLPSPAPAAVPAPVEPATPPAAQPAEPLFGNEPAATPPAAAPPAAPPAVTPPVVTPPAATPPAATPPAAEKADGLFGETTDKAGASTPAAPATPPAATPPAATPPAASPTDELFGPATKEAPKNGGTTTTTKKPAETPAGAESKPAEKPAATPANEDKSKPAGEDKKDEKPKTEEKDPLFGAAPNVLHEAGGLASNEMRQWTDNTGNFSCRGRLIRFYDGQVRLLKANGRTTTVPLARLSTRDLEFVNRQASANQSEVGKTAQSSAMMPAFAN